MARLLINQVLITYPNFPVDIYFKTDVAHGNSRSVSYLSKILQDRHSDLANYLNSMPDTTRRVNLGFEPDDAAQKFSINLDEENFFIPIYLEAKLKTYFSSLGFITAPNFIGNIEVWEHKRSTNDYDAYNVWSMKIDRQFDKYFLTIGLSSQNSRIHKKTVDELDLSTELVKNILIGNEVQRSKFLEESEIKAGKPQLDRKCDLALKIPTSTSPDFSFLNHYQLITNFYDSYLKGKELGAGIHVLASGFREVKESDQIQIPREKNLLEFGNGKTEYDPYRGISNYGPYSVPDNVGKVKFIFIYLKADKDIANSLYKYFKYGYRHFPGLESFSGIPFDLDVENSIGFENSVSPLTEINEQLVNLRLDAQSKYVAIYISPFSEETANDEEKLVYFKLKESLLKLNITSQVIESIKLKSQAVHFYLPNMAIAILAKIGGIPWKLKRDLGNCLLIGFGENRIVTPEGTLRYVGNTVCFDNSGVFKDLTCFEYTEDNLQQSIENAIEEHVKQNGEPQRLVIHYFKDWGSKEARILDGIFKRLNLNIPYVVLNINDTRAKDYLCFDDEYPGKIPVSGTVVELKKGQYLLFNNERHSNDISTYKGDDKYPVKIYITAFNGIDINDKNEIFEMLDQVYQFSRLYWRSVKQKPIPVSIEYAKELTEKVTYFSSKELPNTDIAKKSLWFI